MGSVRTKEEEGKTALDVSVCLHKLEIGDQFNQVPHMLRQTIGLTGNKGGVAKKQVLPERYLWTEILYYLA